PLPVSNAGRDLHRELPRAMHAAGAPARVARILHDLASPAASRTGLRELEHPLVHGDGSGTAALRTRHRLRAGLRPRTSTRLTGRDAADLHRNGRPAHGVVEGNSDLGLEVRSPRRLRPAAAAAPATEQSTEQVAEIAQILHGEPADVHALSAGAGKARAGEPAPEARRGHLAHLVVGLPLLR